MSDKLPNNITRFDMLQLNYGKRKFCECPYPHYEVDARNRLVTCVDCKAIVDPFDAIMNVAQDTERRVEYLEHRLEEQRQIDNYKPRLNVIKAIADMYGATSSTRMVPVCPRCGEAFDLKELVGRVWVNPIYLNPPAAAHEEDT